MADLVRYRSTEKIADIVAVTQAAQRELRDIHTEAAKLAIETLTYTRERIQAAAARGMSETQVNELVEQQKAYLRTMQHIVDQSAAGLGEVVRSLPALPEPRNSR